MIQNIFFDLDGTLTDPGIGITNSVMHALKKHGIEVEDRRELYPFIGPPLKDSFMKYYGFSEEDAVRAIDEYREYFRPYGIFENEVYPGVPELLQALKRAGKRLILATSKPDEFSIRIMKHFGLYEYFDFFSCATMSEKKVEKPEIIQYALDELKITDPDSCVMIGDREHDILGAKAVGIRSIGVLYGYGSREELEEAGADYIAETVQDILKYLDERGNMKPEERLLKYVAYETTSCEDSGKHPSSDKELILAAVLRDEMNELGIQNVILDEHGYVYGQIPASPGLENAPVIGLIAHMDTSDAVSGANIKPRRLHYEGGDIPLSDTVVMRTDVFPQLARYIGHELIVTDGTTLLGADDKAGVAEILTLSERLLAHPEIRHGKIMICFTPDEEIGEGTEFFDLQRFGADFAYTVDGGTIGEYEYECFNAASAKITVNGVSIHPGSAKNKMKNAVLIANELISMLPPAETPSHTEQYEGFYHVNGISGNETEVKISMIIRDHDRTVFENRKAFVERLAAYLNGVYGEGTVELQLRDSYYNMKEMILPHPEVLERIEKAYRSVGIEPKAVAIRGGTDGARLSFEGLPCPNLSTGGENYHGVYEFVSVDDMNRMVDVLQKITEVES